MIPPMPIDFFALAAKGVEVLGEIAAAVAGVLMLSALICMGFRWVRMAFCGDTEDVSVTSVQLTYMGSDSGKDYYGGDDNVFYRVDSAGVWDSDED